MTYHPDELEERDFGRGPALWDLGVQMGDVCCAAFQLGCCPHTEAADLDYEIGLAESEAPYVSTYVPEVQEGPDDYPF
jgi:hypothetical protein